MFSSRFRVANGFFSSCSSIGSFGFSSLGASSTVSSFIDLLFLDVFAIKQFYKHTHTYHILRWNILIQSKKICGNRFSKQVEQAVPILIGSYAWNSIGLTAPFWIYIIYHFFPWSRPFLFGRLWPYHSLWRLDICKYPFPFFWLTSSWHVYASNF